MSLLCRALFRIFHFQIPTTKWLVNSRSLIIPIKMAAEVFQSKSTDPNAPPVMVMHGFLDSAQGLRKICQQLESKTKRKIYNLDARNHGESPHIAAHSSAHMSEDIAFLMSEEKLERVALIGHSMGGRTMMFFALTFPELVEKAIIVDISPVSVPRNIKTMEDIFNAMKGINISPELSMTEAQALVKEELNKASKDKEAVEFIMLNLHKKPSGEFVWRPNIKGLSANVRHFRATQYFGTTKPFPGPVLFIAGKQSVFVNPNDWPKIRAIFPNSELKWLDAGHWVHLEKPKEFIDLVTDFINHEDDSKRDKS